MYHRCFCTESNHTSLLTPSSRPRRSVPSHHAHPSCIRLSVVLSCLVLSCIYNSSARSFPRPFILSHPLANYADAHGAIHENPANSCWSAALSCVCTGVSVGCSRVNSWSKLLVSVAFPIVGKYGGGMRLWKTSSKLTSLKNKWRLISSASASPAPSRRSGSRVRSWCQCCPSLPADIPTHSLQEGHGVSRHRDRIQRFVLQDRIEDFIFVLSSEWRLTQQHLVREDTKRPPVDSSAVSLFEQDLLSAGSSARLIRSLRVP